MYVTSSSFRNVLLCFFTLIYSLCSAQSNWQPMGPDDFNQPYTANSTNTTMAVHPLSGDVYMAYSCFAPVGTGNSFVRKFNVSTGIWESVGGTFCDNSAFNLSLVFDSLGTLYVGYCDSAYESKATVKRFNPVTNVWETVGEAGFSYGMANVGNLAIGSDDMLYICYRDAALGRGVVQKFDGNTWVNVGGVNFSGALNPNLVIGPDGILYVAYSAYGTGNTLRAFLMKFEGNLWEFVGPQPVSGPTTSLVKAAVNPVNNMPYIAFSDLQNQYTASVKKFNGTFWEFVGAAGFSEGVANWLTFAISDDGILFVGCQGLGSKATVLKFGGINWEYVGTPSFSLGAAYWTSIGLAGNTPYFAYGDYQNDSKSTLMKYNGADWECMGATLGISEESLVLNGDSTVKAGDLTITENGSVYIGYLEVSNYSFPDDGVPITVKKYNYATNDWDVVGDRGFANGTEYLSMAYHQNTPYISFVSSTAITVMKYNGQAWENVGETLPTPEGAFENDIAIAPDGTPYIAYIDYVNDHKLTVKKFNGTSWVSVGGAGFTSGETRYPNLEIDQQGIPYVAFMVINTMNSPSKVMRFVGNSWHNVGTNIGWIYSGGFKIGPDNLLYITCSDGAGAGAVRTFNGTSWEDVGGLFTENVMFSVGLSIDASGQRYVIYGDSEDVDALKIKRYNGNSWVPVGNFQVPVSALRNVDMETSPDGHDAVVIYSSPCVYAKSYNIECLTTTPYAINQFFCEESATVAQLSAEGENIRWYTAEHFGNPLTGDTPLVSGTYYVAQMQDDCEGPRLAVEIAIGTDAPVLSEQSLCSGATVSDLLGQNQNLQLYLSEISTGTLAGDTPLSSATYYATQTQNGCESARVALDIVINSTDEPQGDSSQTIIVSSATEATLADLIVEGEEIRWYDAEGNALTTDTQLQNGSTYYATQTLNSCESDVFAVTAEVLLNNVHYDALGLEYYPNPVTGSLHIVSAANIVKIEVYTLYGQKIAVHEWNINAADLDMSNLAGSTYLVRVYTESGDKAFKVVKE